MLIPITDSAAAAAAKYEIELALLGGDAWRLAAPDGGGGLLVRGSYELTVAWGKLIFAWWDESRAQSWRVTAYEVDGAGMRLALARGFAHAPLLLTLRDAARGDGREPDRSGRRRDYRELLARLLTAGRGGARVRRRGAALAGGHARLVLERRGEVILAVGAGAGEAPATVDRTVGAGLAWLAEFNARPEADGRARELWLCLPRGGARTALERLSLLTADHLGARLVCFEVDEAGESLAATRPAAQAELLAARPRGLRWPRAGAAPGRWRDRILALAPGLVEAREVAGGESYAIHGLEFARVAGAAQPSDAGLARLASLARELAFYRSAEAPDRRHPFYRLRAEAWLESLLRRDPGALDPALDGRYVYSQIPAWRGEDRAVIDLLAVTRRRRLVVVEIKAGEDAELPLQGLDYWLRIEQARASGELARRGLFPGVELADLPPRLYLVAPRLRFHRTFAALARCLAPVVEAYRIGINANWRAGVRVVARERVNAPESAMALN